MGAEGRGNSTDRRRRKAWLLHSFGDGLTCPCAHCGAPLTALTCEVARIVPGHLGGTYRRANIRPSCRACNVALVQGPERETRGPRPSKLRARKLWLMAHFGDGSTCPCTHCGRPLTAETCEAHRVVPGHEGGTFARTNLQPSCRACNRPRGPEERGPQLSGPQLRALRARYGVVLIFPSLTAGVEAVGTGGARSPPRRNGWPRWRRSPFLSDR
jgi:5-methylcytosine-specific restriction endonuclease McrA